MTRLPWQLPLFLFLTFQVTGWNQSSVPIRDVEDPPNATPSSSNTRSKVVVVENEALVDRYQTRSQLITKAFNSALLNLTSESSVPEAWATLVDPGDKVAIKISTQGGAVAGTHPALVNEIVQGLQKAGISQNDIVVWDKDPFHMISAGYVPMAPDQQWKCDSVIDGSGWDKEKFYFHEVVGQLIWSDQDFVGAREITSKVEMMNDFTTEAEKKLAQTREQDVKTQISNRSYFANIVTKADKIINLAPMSDHRKIGIYGAFSSLALDSIDNHRRFLKPDRTSAQALAEIYNDGQFKEKAVLHVVSGIIAQYAGGPEFNPNFAASPGLLMISQDPVALDAISRERLEDWRRINKVSPIGENALHLKAAEAWGFGTAQSSKMQIVSISSQF